MSKQTKRMRKEIKFLWHVVGYMVATDLELRRSIATLQTSRALLAPVFPGGTSEDTTPDEKGGHSHVYNAIEQV